VTYDVMPASNGEFFPPPVTPEKVAIMKLQDEEADRLSTSLNMSRRDFVRSAAGFCAGLWAINTIRQPVMGAYAAEPWEGPGTAACNLEWPGAQLNNLPGEFIFDVQSHHIDSGGDWRWNNPGFHAVFAAIWEQSGPLGGFPELREDGSLRGWGEGGEYDPIENLSRYHYLKELYLDSSTNMCVLSAVPSAPDQQPLPVDEAAKTVKTVNRLAAGDAERAVMHAFCMPNRGSMGTGSAFTGRDPVFMAEEFEIMQRHVERYGKFLRGWKVYTPWGDVPNSSGWFLDDEIGMKFIDQVRHLHRTKGGPNVIACHKGFALPAFDSRAASARDIGPAARQNRDINFIVYHSGYDSETQTAYPGDNKVNSSDRGVNSFVKSLRENSWDATRFIERGMEHGNVPNVFAEIGATMHSVMDHPDELAHLLGKLLTFVGPRRVVWGTDSLWFGSPQPDIVALRAFNMSNKAKELYNLPYGLDGDRFDPRRNTKNPHHYKDHPVLDKWPSDGRAHPERSIRNGIFGRNAAIPYKVDPDAHFGKIKCDDVQKIRDGYIVNPATPREVAMGRSNDMHAPRTRSQLLAGTWPNVPWAP
jgi:hypothetical protein